MHNRIPALLLVVVALLAASACGGGSPTAPSNTVDFQGVWQGNWQRTSCTETGGAQGNACNQTPSSGALRLTLTQSGTEVQGTVEVISFVVPASGSVSNAGVLSLNGTSRSTVIVNGVAESASGTLANWSTTRSGSTLNGSFTLTIVADNPAFGSQIVQLTLQSVTKTS
jgi:hypothetical protein